MDNIKVCTRCLGMGEVIDGGSFDPDSLISEEDYDATEECPDCHGLGLMEEEDADQY